MRAQLVLLSLFGSFISSCDNKKTLTSTLPIDNEIKYAKHFTLTKTKNGYKLAVFYDKKNLKKTYYLTNINTKYSKNTAETIILPLSNTILLASSHLGMADALKIDKHIVGISSRKYLCNPNSFKHSKNEFPNLSTSSIESFLKTSPNMIMYDGFETTPTIISKLEQMNISCIPNYDWREESPLGRAEWIKVFGVLYGKEKEANKLFTEIESNYNYQKSRIPKTKKKPSLFAGSLIGDIWYCPSGKSYMAKLYEDAGFDYKYKSTLSEGSLTLSLEQIYMDNFETTYWINPSVATRSELAKLNPKYTKFASFKNNLVFCNSSNRNCFWENAALRPDYILEDLIDILNPEAKSNYKPHFYEKLK